MRNQLSVSELYVLSTYACFRDIRLQGFHKMLNYAVCDKISGIT
jgi:hypothetical protein